jgi:glycosyltransferase involved in cell wall biosynthesis
VIVAAGTLQPWKGFSDLIQAVAILKHRGRTVRLIILGEGPLHTLLEDEASKLGVGDQVKLPGFTHNPLKYFAAADVFVLSSYVEGLPNVLVEAMMCGCTPVSTDCPTGPREVLENGRFGYLVPVRDPEALAAGIEQGLDNPISPDELTLAVQPFEEDTVIRRHFELLGLAA